MDALVEPGGEGPLSCSGGQCAVPMVLLTQHGGGLNAGPRQHFAMPWEAWLAHVPGLKVVVPSFRSPNRPTALAAGPPSMIRISGHLHQKHKDLLRHQGRLPGKAPIRSSSVSPVSRARGSDVHHRGLWCRCAPRIERSRGTAAQAIDGRGSSICVRFSPGIARACCRPVATNTGRLVTVHEARWRDFRGWRRLSLPPTSASCMPSRRCARSDPAAFGAEIRRRFSVAPALESAMLAHRVA